MACVVVARTVVEVWNRFDASLLIFCAQLVTNTGGSKSLNNVTGFDAGTGTGTVCAFGCFVVDVVVKACAGRARNKKTELES